MSNQYTSASIVLIPLTIVTKTKAYYELLAQAKTTLINRRHYLNKTNSKTKLSPHIYNLSSDKYNIFDYVKKCIKDNIRIDIVYIVAHHERYDEIGLTGEKGILPITLAKEFSDNAGEDGLNIIDRIDFFTCNSAYSGISKMESYCGKFARELWIQSNNKNIVIGGFNGFLFEDVKKKHTYIAPVYDDYVKKVRCDDYIVLFNYDEIE